MDRDRRPGDGAVTGESEWEALDPPWDRRDRTRWYEAGSGPLSPDAVECDMLPVPGAPFLAAGSEECLLRVRPPRTGEFSLSGFQGALDSLGEDHILSLELVGTHSETSLLVRTVHPDRMVAALELRYPGVEFERVMPEDDPLRPREGETAWRRVLKPEGPEFLPFSVDDDLNAPPTADRFLSVVGAMRQDLHGDERLLSRVVLRQKAHDWSEKFKRQALSGLGGENARAMERERQDAKRGGAQPRNSANGSDEGSGTIGLFHDPFMVIFLIVFGGAAAVGALAWVREMADSGTLIKVVGYAVAGYRTCGVPSVAGRGRRRVPAILEEWRA